MFRYFIKVVGVFSISYAVIFGLIDGFDSLDKLLIGAIINGLVFFLGFISYRVFLLKKNGIAIDGRQMYKSKPIEDVIFKINIEEIKIKLKNNNEFKLIDYSDNKLTFEYLRKDSSFFSSIIEVVFLSKKEEYKFNYRITSYSKPSFVIFDFGKNYISLFKLKKCIDS